MDDSKQHRIESLYSACLAERMWNFCLKALWENHFVFQWTERSEIKCDNNRFVFQNVRVFYKIMKKKNLLAAAPMKPKVRPTRKIKAKNLSPAKKFRLRLRREKFQKQKQAKDDYYEHDNRDAARNEKKKVGRLNKKGRKAQMYIDAYLKSQHEQRLIRNGDTASYDETQESSNGNEMLLKSIVHRASSIALSPTTSRENREQASANPTTTSSANVAIVKCCCHCACSSRKRKARRKLSSPYFGDFNRTLSFSNGSCAREAAAVTTKIHTTMHRETLVKAGDVVNLNRLRMPVFNNLQNRNGCGLKEMRTVVRFVLVP